MIFRADFLICYRYIESDGEKQLHNFDDLSTRTDVKERDMPHLDTARVDGVDDDDRRAHGQIRADDDGHCAMGVLNDVSHGTDSLKERHSLV